jgi:hypothetical protein
MLAEIHEKSASKKYRELLPPASFQPPAIAKSMWI